MCIGPCCMGQYTSIKTLIGGMPWEEQIKNNNYKIK